MNYRCITLLVAVCVLCFVLTACKDVVPADSESMETIEPHETIATSDMAEGNTTTSPESTETEPATTAFPEFPQVDYELPEIVLDITEPSETQGIPVPTETQRENDASETPSESTTPTEILPTITEPAEETTPTENPSMETPEQEV